MGVDIQQNESSIESYVFRHEKFQTLKRKIPSIPSEGTSDRRGGLWKVLDTNNPRQKMVVSKKNRGTHDSYHVTVLNVPANFSSKIINIEDLYDQKPAEGYTVDNSKSFWMYQLSDNDPISICRYGEESSCIAQVHKRKQKIKEKLKETHLLYLYNTGDIPEQVSPLISNKLETYASVIESIGTDKEIDIITTRFQKVLQNALL